MTELSIRFKISDMAEVATFGILDTVRKEQFIFIFIPYTPKAEEKGFLFDTESFMSHEKTLTILS